MWLGGSLGRQRQGGAVGAVELHSEVLWPGPLARQGRRLRQTAPCLLPASSSLLSATQTPGADGETEEGGRRKRQKEGEGGGANEHNEETDTDYADHLPPSSIHLWVRISLFPTDRLLLSPPLPGVTPSLVCPLFYPSASTARRATRHCVAKHAPTGNPVASVFSKLCQMGFSLFEYVACIAKGWTLGGYCVACLCRRSPILEKLLNVKVYVLRTT